jgi:hypothetical protein
MAPRPAELPRRRYRIGSAADRAAGELRKAVLRRCIRIWIREYSAALKIFLMLTQPETDPQAALVLAVMMTTGSARRTRIDCSCRVPGTRRT